MPLVKNWTGRQATRTGLVVEPNGADEVAAAVGRVSRRRGRLHAFSSGHVWNGVNTSPDTMLDSRRGLDWIEPVDPTEMRVRVGAGTQLRRLVTHLDARGYMLANLGGILQQTVAGAVSTCTHGTGARLGSLGSQVLEVEFVDGLGQRRRARASAEAGSAEEAAIFNTVVGGLGAAGVMVALTLAVEPLGRLTNEFSLPRLDEVLGGWEALLRQNRHVQFCWHPERPDCTMLEVHNPTTAPVGRWAHLRRWLAPLAMALATAGLWLVMLLCAFVPGLASHVSAWGLRWRGGKGAPSAVDVAWRAMAADVYAPAYDGSWAVPVEQMPAAVRRLQHLLRREQCLRFLGVCSVRFVAAETPLLSPAHARDVAVVELVVLCAGGQGLGHAAEVAIKALYTRVEEVMVAEFGGRAHWGKLNTMSAAQVLRAWPAAAVREWQRQRRRLDPRGVFMNGYIARRLAPGG